MIKRESYCFMVDISSDIFLFEQVMCMDYVEEKRELLQMILTGRKLINLPKITQVTINIPPLLA